MAEDAPPPSDEELMKQLEEELKKLKVSDLLVQTLYTVSSLGYRKLSEEDPGGCVIQFLLPHAFSGKIKKCKHGAIGRQLLYLDIDIVSKRIGINERAVHLFFSVKNNFLQKNFAAFIWRCRVGCCFFFSNLDSCKRTIRGYSYKSCKPQSGPEWLNLLRRPNTTAGNRLYIWYFGEFDLSFWCTNQQDIVIFPKILSCCHKNHY